MREKDYSIIKFILFAILSVGLFYIFVATPIQTVIRERFGSLNIPVMAICVIFFHLLSICFRSIKIKISELSISLSFLIAGLFLLISYFSEQKVFDAPNHIGVDLKIPLLISVSYTVVICGLVCYSYLNSKENIFYKPGYKKISRIIIILAALFFGALAFYHQYRLNFTKNYDFYHLNSYTNSIFNLFWGQPFTETIDGIYGHYPFFYYPFLKLGSILGTRYYFKTYLLVTSSLIVFNLFIWYLILYWNVKSNFIRLLGMLLISAADISRLTGTYPMVYPHRIFPMAVTVLMVAIWYRKSRKKMISIIGYILSAFLIVWSTEYGLFSLLSWTALHCCAELQKKDRNYWKILLHLLLIPAVFVFAVLICGGLNVLHGGEMLSINHILYPIMNSQETGEAPLAKFPAAWMSIMVMLLIFLGYGLKDTILLTNYCETNDQSAACFAVSVLGLGSITYAINRPAYANFYIILPTAGLFLAITTESFLPFRAYIPTDSIKEPANHLLKKYAGMTTFCIMFLLAFITIINIPDKLEKHQFYTDTTKVNELANFIYKTKDTDALALGEGALLTYAYIGRDPGIYYYDIPNIYRVPAAGIELTEKLKQLANQSVFVSDDSLGLLPDEFLESHEEISEHKATDIILHYFIPNINYER